MPTNADVLEMPRIADYLGKERIAQDTTVWLTERKEFFLIFQVTTIIMVADILAQLKNCFGTARNKTDRHL